MFRFFKQFFFILILVFSFQSFAQLKIGDKSALVIIDMQPSFVNRNENDKKPENVKKVERILKVQVEAIREAMKHQVPIVFLEYEEKGDTNEVLKNETKNYDKVKFITKDKDGMFFPVNYHTAELIDYLESKNIGTLVIMGANGRACVQDSIAESLGLNYHVVAFSKGIADFNYAEFKYPYAGFYKFEDGCPDCLFKEVNKLSDVVLEFEKQSLPSKHFFMFKFFDWMKVKKDEGTHVVDSERSLLKDSSAGEYEAPKKKTEAIPQ
jgi:nicotinamidase-related amidase